MRWSALHLSVRRLVGGVALLPLLLPLLIPGTARAAVPATGQAQASLSAASSTRGVGISVDRVPFQPQPADLSTTNPALPCTTGRGRPVAAGPIALRALVRDPDPADTVAGIFRLVRAGTGAAAVYHSPLVANGSTAQVAPGLLADGVYSWSVRAVDQLNVSSHFSLPCEFEIDSITPAAAPVVSSKQYPATSYTGGIGIRGRFHFDPAGVTDVASYLYGFDTQSPTRSVAAALLGSSASVRYRPTKAGPHYLTVISADRAGNQSPAQTYRFFVLSAVGPLAP